MPYEKAKAIYLWLADNISYDTSYSIFDADTAWDKMRGVCQAYCELFYRIGSAADLDVRMVIVADAKRLAEYQKKLGYSAFTAIKDRVKFLLTNNTIKKFKNNNSISYYNIPKENIQ